MRDDGKPDAEDLHEDEGGDLLVPDDAADDDPRATPPRDPSKDRAIIAWMLIGMLAGGLVLHYSAVMAFEWGGKHDAVKSLEPILNSWLPVVSGLAGAAVTYYFTRDKR